jgi:hypothetical protein
VASKFTVSTIFKAFDQVSGPLKNMNKAATSLNHAFSLIKTALVGGAIFRVGKSFVSAAADVEKYKTTLVTMLGSVEAANKRFDEMSRFAATTPFELEEVVELGNQLQALGRYSVQTMTNLGDLAAAAGKPADQAARAFAKLASGQKGMAVEMFRDLLISTEDWIKATGKGISKSGSLMATTEEMLAAFPKILAAKGFSGMMAQQSKTWNGFVSNMQDSLTRIKAGLGEGLLEPLKKIGGRLLEVGDRVLAWVNANRELIGTKLDQFVDKLISGVTRGWKILSKTYRTIKAVNDFFGGALIPTILGAVIAFKLISAAMVAWTAITKAHILVTKLQAAAQWLANTAIAGCPLVWIVAAITGVILAVTLMVKHWDKVVDVFHRVRDWIFKALDNPLIRTIATVLAPFITIPLLIIKNWEQVKEIVSGIVDWILIAVEKVTGAVGKIGEFFGGVFGGKERGSGGGQPMVDRKPQLLGTALYSRCQFQPNTCWYHNKTNRQGPWHHGQHRLRPRWRTRAVRGLLIQEE